MPNFDDPNISEECLRCRERCSAKSKNNTFDHECTGIFPADYKLKMQNNLSRDLTESETQAANLLLDPVGWAYQVLGWTPRISRDGIPYQATMLRCDSKRTVSRSGRRIGKSDVMAIDMLYNATTKTNCKVLVVCPQKSHAQVVYDRLTELIYGSADLQNSVKRSIKTPYAEIEFHNQSKIKLFTSGSKSGSEGQSIRGQTADKIYLDESDYLEDADHNAISAILYSSPTTTLWSSSTPTGRRQRFFDQCHDSRYKEFHYPSHVLPFWNDQMDTDARLDSGTEAGYQHEILAEFGEEVEGVYQNKYVDRSLVSYKYDEQIRKENWTYCMGVDWNDTKVGTQIVVVGFDSTHRKYRVVGKHSVDKIGWTQLAAIDKIREINEYWRCSAIYVDQGFGTVQIELLQQFGERRMQEVGAAHPDAKLREVKGINAGGTLEVRNIRTGIPENKPAKPYMIENSVRYFEHDMIDVSKDDDAIIAQLLGYIVERRTSAGMPVYAQGNKKAGDHELDALILALLAFTMEFTEFGQILQHSFISFGGNFGNKNKPLMGEGDLEVVVEHKYKQKKEEEKNNALKPQDRFNIGNESVLTSGLPGIVYSSVNKNFETRGNISSKNKMSRGTRPIRSNI